LHFSQYILTAAEALKDLVDGFDIDPSHWVHDDWNLPESGNGVPDLLDEMQWELDWMLRMQDVDGGVYHKLTSCNWFFGMPHEESAPRLINPKTTHDTGFFAAAVAASSRVFAALHPDAAAADRYLRAAAAAWDFMVLNPGNELGEGVPAGGQLAQVLIQLPVPVSGRRCFLLSFASFRFW
jgi:endoglucanase